MLNTKKLIHNYELIDYPAKGQVYGNYKGKMPIQAAKKIVSKLANDMNYTNSNSKKLIVFMFQNKKTKQKYKYVGTRIKLYEPIIRYINNKKIKYNYKIIATKYNDYYNSNIKKGGNKILDSNDSLSHSLNKDVNNQQPCYIGCNMTDLYKNISLHRNQVLENSKYDSTAPQYKIDTKKIYYDYTKPHKKW